MIPSLTKRATLLIEPMGKPRVLRGEQSKRADMWRRYKRDIQWLARATSLTLPDGFFHVFFYLPPPRSWSETKRQGALGKPVKVKPDKDNLEKALFDALCPENDSHIWDSRSTKLYGLPPRIEIYY